MSREPNDDLEATLEGYRPPPPFPADSLWRRIEAAERGRSPDGPRAVRLPRGVAAAAAVALFAAGAGLGSILQARLGGPALVPTVDLEETGTATAHPAGASVADASHVIWF